jgi:hypothetical protein
VLGWLAYALAGTIVGLALGLVVAVIVHQVLKLRTGAEA